MSISCYERRSAPRVAAAHLVAYRELGDHPLTGFPGLVGLGATIDLSDVGMRCWCTEELPVGHYLKIQLAIGEAVLQLNGRVVHGSAADARYILGVAFERVAAADGSVLSRYLRSALAFQRTDLFLPVR